MILEGEKTEEYREIKPYWTRRFIDQNFAWDCTSTKKIAVHFDACPNGFCKKFNAVEFRNGYSKNAPVMKKELHGIEVGESKPEWCDEGAVEVFVLKLGRTIFTDNIHKETAQWKMTTL